MLQKKERKIWNSLALPTLWYCSRLFLLNSVMDQKYEIFFKEKRFNLWVDWLAPNMFYCYYESSSIILLFQGYDVSRTKQDSDQRDHRWYSSVVNILSNIVSFLVEACLVFSNMPLKQTRCSRGCSSNTFVIN